MLMLLHEHWTANSVMCPEIAQLEETGSVTFSLFSLFLFFSERQSVSRGVEERERETQNLKQAPGSELSAQSPTWGLNPRAMRSRPELKWDAQPAEPPYVFSLERCYWG